MRCGSGLIQLEMAALGVTAPDVSQALLNNNFQSPPDAPRRICGHAYSAATGLENVEGFKNIVIKSTKNKVVRLQDVC